MTSRRREFVVRIHTMNKFYLSANYTSRGNSNNNNKIVLISLDKRIEQE